MEAIKLAVDIGQFLLAVASAFFVAGYWNKVNHRSEQYRYLDETYNEILKEYIANPKLRDPKVANDYSKESDCNSEYHYFAMRVHTFLETRLRHASM